MATNSILTADQVIKSFVSVFMKKIPFTGSINRQYDRSFDGYGAKEGDRIRIKRPQRHTTREGNIMQTQPYKEQYVNLAKTKLLGVDLNFSTPELAQDIEPFTKQTLMPAINTLASKVDAFNLSQAKNQVAQVVGTPGTDPATWLPFGQGKAKLDYKNSAYEDRYALLNPTGEVTTINGLSGLYNPQGQVGSQTMSGTINGNYAGLGFYSSPNVATHTTGEHAGTVLVNEPSGVTEGDTTIDLDGFTSATPDVAVGDVITFAGVYDVNPLTGDSTGELKEWLIDTAKTGSGNAIAGVSLSEAFLADSSDPYRNCTALPADGAAVTFKTGDSGKTTVNNLIYHKDAFTFASVDLPLFGVTDFEAKFELDGMMFRLAKNPDVKNNEIGYRIDILSGFVAVVPEWACRLQGGQV